MKRFYKLILILGLIILSTLSLVACNFNNNSNDNNDDKTNENKNEYVISFDTVGGSSINNVTVIEGEKLVRPTDPTKENAIFLDWYVDNEYNNLYDFDSPVYSSFTLYAKWEEKAVSTYYNVIFNTNGGSLIGSLKVPENTKITKPTEPIKDGYIFGGWYLDSNFTTFYDFDSLVNENLTLYAKWIKETIFYTVSFDTVGGSKIEQVRVEAGSLLEEKEPIREGFSFGGWYLDSAYQNKYDFNKPIDKNLTLYAKWEEIIVSANLISEINGNNENISLIINSDLNGLEVSYKLTNSDIFTKVDSELIRVVDGKVRCDIVGLKASKYDVKVKVGLKEEIKNNVEVLAYDRSGYAFFKNDSVGAYNQDGTLKEDALIIYVSNQTKNTVEAKINGKTYTGLVNILQNVRNSKVPVVIRILDKITTNQWQVKDDAPRLADGSNYKTNAELEAFVTNTYETTYGENLVGLRSKLTFTGYKSLEYITTTTGIDKKLERNDTSKKETTYNKDKYSAITGKKVYDDDSYNNMLDIEEAKNVTLEGVGTTAEFFQFGLTWKKCNNIEVRNITFSNTTEDGCSFEGANGSEDKYGYYFIHHNTFNRGKNNWDISGERDKAEGDGSMDFKYLHNVSVAYNRFNNPHKTSLVGGSDSNIQYNFTFHHNYYNEVESRLPLGRQANMHIYNNYFYKVSSSSVDLRAGAYAFLEKNYFEDSKLPRTRKKEDGYGVAVIKAYDNYVDDKSSLPSDNYNAWQKVDSRTAIVKNNCNILGINYSFFDTNSELFYYDSVNKCSDVLNLTAAKDVKNEVINNAGVLTR